MGVLKALKCFRTHVAATEIPITILTDHANLTHWKAMRKVNRQLARWFTELQDYNLMIKHMPGKIHMAPDMLSQPHGVDHGEMDNSNITVLPPAIFITSVSTQEDALKQKVRKAQQKQRAKMKLWCNTQGVRKLPKGYTQGWRMAVPSGLVLRHKVLA